MTKVVFQVTNDGGEPRTLATFRMAGDRLVAHFEDDGYQQLAEKIGFIVVVDGADRELTTADGRLFFDNLELFHHRSSTIGVRTES